MDIIGKRIEKYLPMRGMEKAFKYIYENHLDPHEVDPNSWQIQQYFQDDPQSDSGIGLGFNRFRLILTMEENEPLVDERIFSPEENISVTRHPRYMPAVSHFHQGFFEIQCVLSGKLSQVIGDIPVTLYPGDLCFIAPNAMHSPIVQNDDTVMINIIVRTSTLQSALTEFIPADDVITHFFMNMLYGKTYQPMLICATGLAPHAFGLVLDMIEEAANANAYTNRALTLMLQLLCLYLIRDHKNDFTLGRQLHKTDDSILNIIRYVKKNFASITLSDLAVHFNYSPSYLSYLIKNYYSQTFQEMLTDLRMQEAARLLTSSDAGIMDIIVALGYTEKSYFYRIFKKKYGMTPQEYRLRCGEDRLT